MFLLVLIVPIGSLKTEAQQPSVYSVKRMTFNVNGFSNISPVIVNIAISSNEVILFEEKAGKRLPVINDSTITLFFPFETILNSPGCPEMDKISFNIKQTLKFWSKILKLFSCSIRF